MISQQPVDPSCEFCKIVSNHASTTQIVHETGHTLAFFPLKPAAIGHTLVVPKQHVTDLLHADNAIIVPLMDVVMSLARAIVTALSPDGLNLINSTGHAASQTVFHLHMHLVPRWHHDSFGDIWPSGRVTDEDTDKITAGLIRTAASGIDERANR